MRKSTKSILLLACLLLAGQYAGMAQNKHAIIKTVEKYYDGLNAYAMYDQLGQGNITILFAKSGNTVHNDLRQLQGQGDKGIVRSGECNVVAYLNTINTLVRNTGKQLTFDYKINKSSYQEEWVRNAHTSSYERRATITVIKEITYGTTYSNQRISIQDDITLVDGLIAKIESKEYVPPLKSFAQKVFESDEYSAYYIWGTTNLAFAGTIAVCFGGHTFGLGCEVGPWERGGYKVSSVSFLLQYAYGFRYFGFGALCGLGGIRNKELQFVHGEPISLDNTSHFAAYLAPYFDIRLPVFWFAALQLAVGYNFYLTNGPDLNGLRFGLGIDFDI